MVAVIAVWAYMAVCGISEFLYHLIQFLLRPEFIQVSVFVLQGIKIPLHRRIVIWVSGLAHALGHIHRFAKLDERL